MAYVDTTAPDPTLMPGVDLWVVEKCEERPANDGSNMFALDLKRASGKAGRLYDYLVFGGPGWGIAKKKLPAFGVPDGFKGELDPLKFRGLKLWAATKIDNYKGRDKLAVDLDQLRCGGYQPEGEVPEGCAAPDPVQAPSDTPF